MHTDLYKPKLSNLGYPILFIFFVLADTITTFLMYQNIPGFIDLNPNIHFLHTICNNSAIFYITFTIIKILVLNVIYIIIDFQNEKIKHSGYITYTIILIASLYVFINNLSVLGYI